MWAGRPCPRGSSPGRPESPPWSRPRPPFTLRTRSPAAGRCCAICSDPRLISPSGITAAADGNGWWIVSSADGQDETLSVMRVGEDCSVIGDDEAWVDHLPRDPQALVLDADGFVWVGDIGGATDRDWLTVNQLNTESLADSAIFRYVFPGDPEAVEAFLIPRGGDKKPLFITAADGEANLFYPPGENQEENTPMENVGSVTLSEGGSVTGAALNADGTKAALRTATAVYEWTVAENDLIGTLTGTEPVVTPITDRGTAQGLAYDADGNFITLASGSTATAASAPSPRTRPAAPAAEEDPAPREEPPAAGRRGPVPDSTASSTSASTHRQDPRRHRDPRHGHHGHRHRGHPQVPQGAGRGRR